VRGKSSDRRFSLLNGGTKVSEERMIVDGTGMTAATAISICFPSIALFASISDPWPHRLLVSCDWCGVLAGGFECL